MRYDFTSHMERHGKDSIAVDGLGTGFAPEPPEEGFDVIPMWAADMNFPTVPTVTDAIIERAKHPAFGYFSPTDEYYDSIIRWQETRNGVTGLAPEHIGYENGVLGGVVATLNSFVAPGDKVLLHSPTYIGFTKSLENNGLSIVHSPLKIDEDGVWRMNFEDMEAKLAQNDIHAAVFCSPHNPCGRVWERWEIERAMELYRKYDCVVVSDEIWSDLILPGHRHVPTQSVSDDARRRTVAEQDLQPGRPGWLLPRHIRQEPARPRHFSQLQVPLQRHERALHARARGRVQAGGIRVGGRAHPGPGCKR